MARQRKVTQQTVADGSRLTGCVTRTHGRHHYVTTEDGTIYEAHRRGKKSDVVVGDIVTCSQPSGGVVAIESIEPRVNLLYRSDEWRIKELASNLTLVACVFASRPTFNPKFVWKAIVAAQAADIPVLVIRNKADLADKAKEAATEEPKRAPIRREKPALTSAKPAEPKPHRPRNRVLDKSILVGSPSERVSQQRASLPITKYKSKVLEMIQHNQVSIVSGGTGCGKSTQVPQFLIEAFRESDQKDLNIVVCEPRRVSCLGLYLRVIEEQGFVAGSQCPIGYQVQGDVKCGETGKG